MGDNKNSNPIKSALILLSLILFGCWYLIDITAEERITLVVAGSHNILVQDKDNHTTEISININISNLINKDEKYDIQYKKRLWQRPRLISITPINVPLFKYKL
ncbi:hypothetical protein Back11_17770 [Paenibacillus baekrokdamisoli]|uniref:Uncharacterized protein n=1 Tax=Paenibacillus baekrokdamisoli TaxID=1712516 RepID=A0A3G9IQ84_9BACL|nr:hypothetical protein [Paenibacillus baekrokdamisoli]MBB3073498.1 hypothetical protein [Paenibacillus baekrokdamisoli]BBH20432.1 hypothetical protein Back11_17770 [Paenibacillus baekrokdamisoli]